MKKSFLIDNEELMKDWDYSKNSHLKPEILTISSNKHVWWKCHVCNYEWNTTVGNRGGTLKRQCPNCSKKEAAKKNSLIKAEKNNIAKTYPEIALEWHPTKNGDLTPEKISYGSEKSVWWKCSWCGTEWEARINKRTTRGYGCPNCSKSSTSFPEQAIYYFIKKYYPDAINRDISNGFELDVYIPSNRTGIEYDGIRWHKSNAALKKDNEKDEKCKKCKIKLIRIRDPKLSITYHSEIIFARDGNIKELENGIKQLLVKLKIKKFSKIDIISETPYILTLYRKNIRENSIAYKFPELADEWHPTKNGDLTPENIYAGSGKKVWWKCNNCNYEWQASPNDRTNNNKKSGCPVCARNRVTNSNKIQVKNLDTNIIYNSLTEAANSVNGKKYNICDCLNGNQKTAYGYHWAYVDETKRRRKTLKCKIRNVDKNIIFNNSKEAAKWCNGDTRMINRCCNKVTQTAYGYKWEYLKD